MNIQFRFSPKYNIIVHEMQINFIRHIKNNRTANI